MASDNPFEQPVPEDMLARVHAFARDLAFGAATGLWNSRIFWQVLLHPELNPAYEVFARHISPKWAGKYPSEHLLVSLAYLVAQGTDASRSEYLLTEKAFKLLEKPAAPPNVFISYRRSDSSALALLIEARLRMAGNPNPFVDKSLVAGQEWNKELEARVKSARYFIMLIGVETLDSSYVRDELTWAEQSNCTIISVWHGCKPDDTTPKSLSTRHAILVESESALGYETAINQLLNGLGYATY